MRSRELLYGVEEDMRADARRSNPVGCERVDGGNATGSSLGGYQDGNVPDSTREEQRIGSIADVL